MSCLNSRGGGGRRPVDLPLPSLGGSPEGPPACVRRSRTIPPMASPREDWSSPLPRRPSSSSAVRSTTLLPSLSRDVCGKKRSAPSPPPLVRVSSASPVPPASSLEEEPGGPNPSWTVASLSGDMTRLPCLARPLGVRRRPGREEEAVTVEFRSSVKARIHPNLLNRSHS